jgi:tRNA threonylcarbamoyladenosine biosynthesis protein TsaE
MTFSTSTTGPEATQALAAKLAANLIGGDVVELRSDLGGGKTTFVQGLARALGYTGGVTSPTFTLSQIYSLPSGLELHHYDLYRLNEAGVVGDELGEDIGDDHNITVIEWAGIAESNLPTDRLVVEFSVTGENDREITLSGNGQRATTIIEAMK